MKNIYLFFSFALFLIPANGLSQRVEKASETNQFSGFFLSAGIGTQMSGIKNEDFISSNYSPLLNISAGKWFTNTLALELGYRGNYFNTISDNIKHFYHYYYGQAVFDISEIIKPAMNNRIWSLYFNIGSGYFHNEYYKRPNICANLGFTNSFQLSQSVSINLNFSAIMGWDIYQGDKDILPGLSVGGSYIFK